MPSRFSNVSTTPTCNTGSGISRSTPCRSGRRATFPSSGKGGPSCAGAADSPVTGRPPRAVQRPVGEFAVRTPRRREHRGVAAPLFRPSGSSRVGHGCDRASSAAGHDGCGPRLRGCQQRPPTPSSSFSNAGWPRHCKNSSPDLLAGAGLVRRRRYSQARTKPPRCVAGWAAGWAACRAASGPASPGCAASGPTSGSGPASGVREMRRS